MGVEVWPCERCNGSGHVGWFRLTPCPSCRASIRKHLPTGTAGVDAGARALCDGFRAVHVDGDDYQPFDKCTEEGKNVWRGLANLTIRAALAASTRTGEDAHPTTQTRGSDE